MRAREIAGFKTIPLHLISLNDEVSGEGICPKLEGGSCPQQLRTDGVYVKLLGFSFRLPFTRRAIRDPRWEKENIDCTKCTFALNDHGYLLRLITGGEVNEKNVLVTNWQGRLRTTIICRFDRGSIRTHLCHQRGGKVTFSNGTDW